MNSTLQFSEIKRNILIVEDEDWLYKMILLQFRSSGNLETHNIIRARNIQEIRNIISGGTDSFDFMSFDGNLVDHSPNGKKETTLEIIREIRDSGFEGKMIAASAHPHLQKEQMEMGCDMALLKNDIARTIKKLIRETTEKAEEILAINYNV